jgi:large subunit ribosomal protein L9
MKVILMQKIERLGEPGQQVEVADGFARNFLLPKQLAVLATPGRVRSLTQLTAQAKNREDRSKQEAQALAERLSTVQLIFMRRAAEETPAEVVAVAPAEAATEAAPPPTPVAVPAAPKLFGSVTSQDVSEALATRGFSVEKKQIILEEPIKTLGVCKVPVRLHTDVLAELTITVEREV